MRIISVFIFLTGLIGKATCQNNILSHELFISKADEINKNSWQDSIHINDKIAFEQLYFYEKDFNTKLSNHLDTVIFLNIDYRNKENIPFQISLLSFTSKDKNDISYLKKKLDSLSRSNLKVKVLTIFKIFYSSNEILIISTETPNNPEIKKIF